jgi:hypothetical protein
LVVFFFIPCDETNVNSALDKILKIRDGDADEGHDSYDDDTNFKLC